MRSSSHAQPKVLVPTLLSFLWPWFIAWSVLALVVLPMQLHEVAVAKWTTHVALGAVLRWVVRYFDAIWYLLALLNVYRFVAQREGLRTARRWALIGVPVLALVLTQGVRTGMPFGAFYYTPRLGWSAGGMPPVMAVLLWFMLVVLVRYAALALLPKATRAVQAAAGAGLLVVVDALLEQVAWKVRFYWMWPSEVVPAPVWPPVQNFVAWGVIGFALLWVMGRGKATEGGWRPFARPLMVLGVLCGVWLVARGVTLLGGG